MSAVLLAFYGHGTILVEADQDAIDELAAYVAATQYQEMIVEGRELPSTMIALHPESMSEDAHEEMWAFGQGDNLDMREQVYGAGNGAEDWPF